MLYHFKDFNNRDAHCDVERFNNVFLVTELPINNGASITNCIELLANKFCKEADVKPEEIQIVEHYVTDIMKNEATYDKVTFDIIEGQLVNPKWERITAMDYINMISIKEHEVEEYLEKVKKELL